MTDAILTADSVTADPAEAIAGIAAAIKARTVVPYVGPGAFDLLPEDACPIPRNSAELVKRLNAKVAAPGRIRSQLTAVAQFIESRRHRKTLEKILDEIFKQEVPSTPVHRFVASIPAPALVVDVWYDAVLEGLLAADATRTWGEVQGLSHPQSTGEWVHYFGPGGSPADADAAQAWETLLYKPSGSVAPAGNYLISDSDFVEILTEIDIQTPIPPEVQKRRTGKHFLFLGCRFDQEIQRTFGRQISKRSSDSHWAVLPGDLTRNEIRFLEKHGIRRIDLPLGDAVAQLEAALAG